MFPGQRRIIGEGQQQIDLVLTKRLWLRAVYQQHDATHVPADDRNRQHGTKALVVGDWGKRCCPIGDHLDGAAVAQRPRCGEGEIVGGDMHGICVGGAPTLAGQHMQDASVIWYEHSGRLYIDEPADLVDNGPPHLAWVKCLHHRIGRFQQGLQFAELGADIALQARERAGEPANLILAVGERKWVRACRLRGLRHGAVRGGERVQGSNDAVQEHQPEHQSAEGKYHGCREQPHMELGHNRQCFISPSLHDDGPAGVRHGNGAEEPVLSQGAGAKPGRRDPTQGLIACVAASRSAGPGRR